MCLIIYKPSGQTIPDTLLRNASLMNQDGTGATMRNGTHTFRSERTVGSNTKLLKAANEPTAESWVHFRFATHGDDTIRNCHPFEVVRLGKRHRKNPDPGHEYTVWLMHNGVISNLGDRHESDTSVLARIAGVMARDNPRAAVECDSYAKGLESLCQGSRVVLIDSRGIYRLLHKADWIQRDGLLLSNTYHDSDPAQYSYDRWDDDIDYPYDDMEPFEVVPFRSLPTAAMLRATGKRISRKICNASVGRWWVVMDDGMMSVSDDELDQIAFDYWEEL